MRWGLAQARRLAGGMMVVGTLGLGLAACGSGNADARAACTDVYRSLHRYEASLHAATAARRSAEQQQALTELRAALTPAANAGTQYQALMTTINESPAVPEGTLRHALLAQCAAASSPGGASGGASGIVGSLPPTGSSTGATGGPGANAPAAGR